MKSKRKIRSGYWNLFVIILFFKVHVWPCCFVCFPYSTIVVPAFTVNNCSSGVENLASLSFSVYSIVYQSIPFKTGIVKFFVKRHMKQLNLNMFMAISNKVSCYGVFIPEENQKRGEQIKFYCE